MEIFSKCMDAHSVRRAHRRLFVAIVQCCAVAGVAMSCRHRHDTSGFSRPATNTTSAVTKPNTSTRHPISSMPSAGIYYLGPTGDLFFNSSSGIKRFVADDRMVESNHNYGQIAYLIEKTKGCELILCNFDGTVIWKRAIWNQQMKDISHYEDVRIRQDRSICIEAEICPGLDRCILIFSDIHKPIRSYVGTDFTWNNKCDKIAYFRDPPSYAYNMVKTEVWVNGRPIYKIKHDFNEQLAWETDGITLEITSPKHPMFKLDVIKSPTIESEFGE